MVGGREIKIVLSVDDNDLSVKMVRAGATVRTLTDNIKQTAASTKVLESHFGSLSTALRDATLTISAMRFALRDVQDIFLSLPSAVIKASSQVERMTALMRGLSNQIGQMRDEDAKNNTGFIFGLAKTAPFDVKSLGDAFVKLKVGGIDPTKGSLQALVDSVARFGGTGQTLEQAALAIQQMGGKGAISMEELRRQLGEAIPDAMQAMALGTGKSMAELDKLVSTGQVAAAGNIERMLTVLAVKNQGAAASMAQTWTGLMEQLSTKWTLFMNDVGKAGFFDETKKNLKDLVDVFNSEGAMSAAKSIGDTMAATVKIFADGIKVLTQYGTLIEWIAGLMAAKFVGNKLTNIKTAIFGGGDTEGSLTRYRKQIEDQVLARRAADIEALTSKIATNNAMIAENERAAMAEDRSNKARMLLAQRAAAQELAEQQDATAKKIAALEMQAAASKTATESMIADLARMSAAREADLREQNAAAMKAAGNRGGGLNKITQGIGALAAEENNKARAAAQARVTAEKQLTQTIEQQIQAEKERVAALTAAQAAQVKQIAAAREAGVATSLNGTLLRDLNANLSNANNSLKLQAESLTRVTLGARLFEGAITGLKNVFAAFGGWVGLAIAAVAYLSSKLMDFMDRWKKAEDLRQRLLNGGTASEDDSADIEKRVAEQRARVADLQRQIEDAAANGGYKNVVNKHDGISRVKVDIASLQRQLEEAKAGLAKFADTAALTTASIAVQEAQTQFNRVMLDHDKLMTDLNAKTQAQIQKIEEEGKTAAKAAANPAAAAAIDKQTRAKVLDAIKANLEANYNDLKKINDDAKAKVDRLVASGAGDAAITAAKKIYVTSGENLQRVRDQLDSKLGELSLTSAKNKQPKIEREDPILKWATQAAFGLEQAKVKLEQAKTDADQLVARKNEIAAELLGKIASGEADHKSTDGVIVDYVGGKKEREKFLADFRDQVMSGKVTVESFIDSLKGLSAAQKQALKSTIENTAAAKLDEKQTQLVVSAKELAAKAQSDLDQATENFSSKASKLPGLDHLVAQFEKLKRAAAGSQTALDAIRQQELTALANETTAGVVSFRQQAEEEMAKSAITNATTVQGKIDAERDMQLQAVQQLENAHKLAISKYVTDENQKAKDLIDLDAATTAKRSVIMAKYYADSKSEIQKLADTWADSAQEMNQLTAKWANGFVSTLTSGIETGRLKLGDLLKSISVDVLGAKIKQSLGGGITEMFNSLSGKISGLTGLGTSTADAAKQKVASDAAATAMGEMASSVTGYTSGALAQQITQTVTGTAADTTQTTATSLASTTLTLFTTALSTATAALYAMASASAASSASSSASTFATVGASLFADGGVMTSKGRIPLNFYENGGVARSAQMAIFGEGDMPEAYVPLPDGRSIPVTMRGPMPSQQGGVANVVVNVINQSSQPVNAQQSQPRFDGKQMILDVVLTAAGQPGGFRDGMRAAMGT